MGELINEIEIENFRSCRSVTLTDLRPLTALAGPNNVGKSNILRGLSLFFTGELEPGLELDFARDYGGPQRGRRHISVSVSFELPPSFSFPSPAENAGNLLGDHFKLTYTWRPRELSPELHVVAGDGTTSQQDEDLQGAAETAMRLIDFRYIPPHRNPADILGRARTSIQKEIMRRFKTRLTRERKKRSDGTDEGGEAFLAPLEDVAEQMVSEVSDAVADEIPGVEKFRVQTPSEIAEAVFELGYELIFEGGQSFDDVLQGSGVQSTLMFRLLHLSDTAFARHFGWRQHAIWAVEEPELFLHTSLEWNLARFLQSETGDPDGRFQVFAVTHSDIFMRYSDIGFLVNSEGLRTEVQRVEPDQLVDKASQIGVSRLEHALLKEPDKPLVITEGKTDVDYLAKVWEISGLAEVPNIASIRDVSDETGGSSQIVNYLERNNRAIACRPNSAPIIVVLDWKEKDKRVADIEKALSEHSTSCVIRMDEAEANPDLQQQFTGIERFVSTRIVEYGDEQGWYTLRTERGQERPYSVDRSSLDSAKVTLANYFAEHAQVADIEYLRPVVDRISEAIAQAQDADE